MEGSQSEPTKVVEGVNTGGNTETGNENSGTKQPRQKRSRRTKTTSESNIQTPEVVAVNIPGEEKDTEEKTVNEKQKRKTSSRKNKKVDSEPVKQALLVGFSLLSMRAGEHWSLQESEADQLAQPLANIADKYGLLGVGEKYGDFIALGIAGVSVLLPRILMQKEITKLKAENQALKLQVVKEENPSGAERESGKVNGSIRKNDKQQSIESKSATKGVLELLSEPSF